MNFYDWVPIRIYWKREIPMVDWMYLGEERLRDPFFDSGVQITLESPFHRIFRIQTPMDALREWYSESPGLKPAGFIFHASRCGSTLGCSTLDALGGNLILSEPFALEATLRAHLRLRDITETMRIDWLRWVVSALAQRKPGLDRLFIKFDAWAIAELPMIEKVFPDTPWIFLYREPLEILVSQALQPSRWAMPGGLHPALVNIPQQDMIKMDRDEYCSRAVARVCEFGLFHAARRGGLLVNYTELPEVMWSRVARHFGLNPDGQDVIRMQQAAKYNAKHPSALFEADTEDKREAASERQREVIARWAEPLYHRLEKARANQALAEDRDSPTSVFNHSV